MKNRLVILFTLLLLTPKQTAAQNEGAAAAAIIGAGLAIGAGIAAVKQMEERAELTATQWILSNNPELSSLMEEGKFYLGLLVKVGLMIMALILIK